MKNRFVTCLATFALAAVVVASNGCGKLLEGDPITRATEAVERVAGPAIEKAVDKLDPDSLSVTGTAALVEPGYVIDGEAMACHGVKWKVAVYAKGASGTVAGSTVASPGDRASVNPLDPDGRSEPKPDGD